MKSKEIVSFRCSLCKSPDLKKSHRVNPRVEVWVCSKCGTPLHVKRKGKKK